MHRVLVVLAVLFGLCTSAHAERIAIWVHARESRGDGAFKYYATIIDHARDLSNLCFVTWRYAPPTQPLQFQCRKLKYRNLLGATSNITSVFLPTPTSQPANQVVWEADQNTGAVQVCVMAIANPEEPCLLLKLSE